MGCCHNISESSLELPRQSPIKLAIGPSQFIKLNTGQLIDNYQIMEILGVGTFGSVSKVKHKATGQVRALKTIKKLLITSDPNELAHFMNEINALRMIDHPYIMRIYEFYEDKANYYIVNEYISGGELFDYIMQTGRLSEATASHFMRQLLSAVAYCHSIGIVHRDIKPENLLLNAERTEIKLIDFGASALIAPGTEMSQACGTAYYMAPEVFTKKYTEKCDLWSCGVLLYLLLSGSPPFEGRSDLEIIENVKNTQPSYAEPEWIKVSADAKDLVERLLDRDPQRRLSAAEALEHPFLLRPSGELSNRQLGTVLNRLKHFRASQKLQHAVYTFIATQLRDKLEVKEITQAFNLIDSNGDGQVSRDELLAAFKRSPSVDIAEAQVDSIMGQVDMDENGSINFTEFLIAASRKETLVTVQNLETCFKLFDRDGSGMISCEELKEILGSDSKIDPAVWEALINEVDENGDGQIDFSEFRDMMFKAI